MESINFDKVWAEVGELGRYQIFLCVFLMIIACFINSWAAFTNIFLLYIPNHHCNNTYSWCRGANYSACEEWEFDQSNMRSSVVTKFGLICEYQHIAETKLISAATAVGIIGAITFGNLQDRIGRKYVMFLSVALYVFASIPSAFIDNFYAFVAVRGLVHLNNIAAFNSGYTFALEMTGPSKRTLISSLLCAVYAIGTMSLGLVAYIFRDLFEYILASSIPFVLLFLAYPVVCESPRWLMSVGKYKQGIEALRKVSKWNGRPLTEKQVKQILSESHDLPDTLNPAPEREWKDETKGPRLEVIRMFKGVRMRTIFLTIIFAWCATNVTYQAIAYNAKNIGKSFFLAYTLQAFVEMPATLLNIPVLQRFGRIWPLSLSMLASGILCLLAGLQDYIPEWLSVAFAVGAKFGICMGFAIIYQLAIELYPTEVRGLAMGLSSVVASAAALAMPFIVSTAGIYASLPMIIMGIMCSLGGIVVLVLPETKYRPMLEKLEQVDGLPNCRAAFTENWNRLRRRNTQDQ